jgi:hypothetical protein
VAAQGGCFYTSRVFAFGSAGINGSAGAFPESCVSARQTTLGELIFIFSFFASFFCEVIPHYLKLLAQIWVILNFCIYFISFFSFC